MIIVRDKKGIAHKVPCGKCAFCLTNKRSSWMFRVHHEMRSQKYPGWFLTLTYDEKHVKRVDDGRLSLRFRDVQLYLKRIRKAKYYAKYICVGEYGSETHRPHYHILLWTDCPAEELQNLWKSSKDGSLLGLVHYGRITMQSAMYTLKYIIQPKQRDVDGIERTRAQFSKGLGLDYLTSQVYEYHTWDYEEPQVFSVVDGRKVSLPRYYKNKIFTKYQMRKQCSIVKSRMLKEETKLFNDLRRQGICRGIRPYLNALRVEQARRIISSTKFNQLL